MVDKMDPMKAHGFVQERSFTSQTPFVGGLLVWLRTKWLNVAARWYIRPLTQQQNQLNMQMINQMDTFDYWLLHQDHVLVEQQAKTAVLTTYLTTLQQRIEAIDQRLAQQEQQQEQTK